ncbi:hypothetical protein OHD16_05920 [Sphingobacterium sp. ML3W]|uniref:hypothetical protein n=1 Tax=Sphingobacterium sp. ML3W TaxID=1538644 RepID=UPI00249A7DE9|nr:hypothetical protein [Sphingobacterium sp. ML3W]WFA79504.1 hypothetical protein OGI71_26165 [Sphingobacterium sp. ML3W]
MKIPYIFPLFILSLLVSCQNDDSKKQQVMLKDYNIIIAPDLSNRINTQLYPKPIHDTVLIQELIDHSDELLKLNNRSSGQLDVYKLDFINRGILNTSSFDPKRMTIDFNRFSNNQLDRVSYIHKGLKSDVEAFSDEVNRVYDYALKNQSGADVWNYFNETIKSSLVDVSPKRIDGSSKIIVDKKNTNVLLLLTDGYIESPNKGRGYRLGSELVSKIRKDYNASGKRDLAAFIEADSSYTINKTDFNLKDVNIFIGELVDRSLDPSGAAKEQPTDFQITKVIWEKWLKDSGCTNVKVIQAVNTKEQFYQEFEQFLKTL